jgi:hypothetical protein
MLLICWHESGNLKPRVTHVSTGLLGRCHGYVSEYPAVSVSRSRTPPESPPPKQCDQCLTCRQPIRGVAYPHVLNTESTNWVRVGNGQLYLSHIGGCTPDRVIWLATLFYRRLWRKMLPISPAVAGANWACTYKRRESAVVECLRPWKRYRTRWPSPAGVFYESPYHTVPHAISAIKTE